MEFEGLDVFIPPPPGLGSEVGMRPVAESRLPDAIVRQVLEEKCFVPDPTVMVNRCTCFRCGKTWLTLQQVKPKSCPGCKSNWWDRVRTPRAEKPANGFRKEKVRKRTPLKKRRPKNHATDEVAATWPIAECIPEPDVFPEIPVEVLGAVDRPALIPTGDPGDESRYVQRVLSPAALEALRASVPAPVATKSDTPVEIGLTPDVGGVPAFTDPPMDVYVDDDDWYQS